MLLCGFFLLIVTLLLTAPVEPFPKLNLKTYYNIEEQPYRDEVGADRHHGKKEGVVLPTTIKLFSNKYDEPNPPKDFCAASIHR